MDLTGSAGAGTNGTNNSGSASDDLLMLSGPNPFIQNIVNQSYAATTPNMMNPGMSGMGMAQPMMNPFQQSSKFIFKLDCVFRLTKMKCY